MSNFKQKKITTKNGKEYTLQHPGVRTVAKINDRVKNKHGIPSEEKVCDEMFAHVVVEPKVKIEDFESYIDMMEVANKAYYFITGVDDPDKDKTDGNDQ
ncbi:hypothetical protein PAECIP111893_00265 [Paenibacillus plantiphilus]|uniref:Phage protein n=1 Tax=Paenibacillus plantiphilus TaxID=2905650 RepID=A0ABM9BMB8_9BACL|nr:hypothetical protein [Paenibacillus plantiphilus]CAH1190303.1 hypothetical protein PAECIP111893_00265 [Paenibacillus plantiphilus]